MAQATWNTQLVVWLGNVPPGISVREVLYQLRLVGVVPADASLKHRSGQEGADFLLFESEEAVATALSRLAVNGFRASRARAATAPAAAAVPASTPTPGRPGG